MAKRERAAGEAPKRKRGRPKGTPKTGGRVKRTSIQIAKDKARDSIWSYVTKGLSGQAVKSRGPTGKAISQPLTEDNQIRLLQTAWRKLEPDLNATAVSADIKTEHVHKEPAEPRELARSILAILETAKLADEPIAEPFVDPRPAPHQLLLGRDAVIELKANSDAGQSIPQALNGEGPGALGSGPSSVNTSSEATPDGASEAITPGEGEALAAASSPPDKKLEHGDRIEIAHNGAHCWWDENRQKWHVFDSNNVPHGLRAIKSIALEHAERLPRGPQNLWQPHPFKEITAQQIGVEPRADNRQQMPRATLTVHRSRPR